MSVRVRFAPSPTGFLHIGGVRTALFNWLYARMQGGQFILRIDDTDEGRNIESTLEPILRGLKWIGLDWDEGPNIGGPHSPYFQSQRKSWYERAVSTLLRVGAAYRDYATPEEVEAERLLAGQNGRPFRYSRKFAAFTESQRALFEAQGRSCVVRLKMPSEGEYILRDLIRGDVRFPWAQEQDHVIQRKDGTFIYHLASVVDDCEFGITHVLRAEEHLSNTPRQYFIACALGFPDVRYGHLPYVAEPGSKRKLSKRKLDQYLRSRDFKQIHTKGVEIAERIGLELDETQFNPVCIDFYEQIGYLPSAILNYLALLGWSLDDNSEFFDIEELVRDFSLERIHPAPASFDPAKLSSVQAAHFRKLSTFEKVAGCATFARRAGFIAPGKQDMEQHLARVIELLGDRMTVFGEIATLGRPYFEGTIEYRDEKAFSRLVRPEMLANGLAHFLARLQEGPHSATSAVDPLVQECATACGADAKDLMQALRVAVIGGASGPAVQDILSVMGAELFKWRLSQALSLR